MYGFGKWQFDNMINNDLAPKSKKPLCKSMITNWSNLHRNVSLGQETASKQRMVFWAKQINISERVEKLTWVGIYGTLERSVIVQHTGRDMKTDI